MTAVRMRCRTGPAVIVWIGLLVLVAGCGNRSLGPGVSETPEVPEDAVLAAPPETTDVRPYLIDVGDDLDIDFFYQPELSRKAVVRSDGKITLPGVGEIQAAGRGPQELATAITGAYGNLLKDPLVTVGVSQKADARVFVVGEVVRPGGYPLRGRMTLSTAVSEAGGASRWAKLEGVVVFRRTSEGTPGGFRVDARGLRTTGSLTPEIELVPDDIVYIPRSMAGKVGDALDVLFHPALYYVVLLLLR